MIMFLYYAPSVKFSSRGKELDGRRWLLDKGEGLMLIGGITKEVLVN